MVTDEGFLGTPLPVPSMKGYWVPHPVPGMRGYWVPPGTRYKDWVPPGTCTLFSLRKLFFIQISLVIINVYDKFNKENCERLLRLRWNFGRNWALLGRLGQGF